MTTKAQQACLDAAKIIERDGWCRHYMHRHGRHCALGAIQKAIKKTDRSIRKLAWNLLGDAACIPVTMGIGIWNDRQKSRVPVIAALRKAGGAAE